MEKLTIENDLKIFGVQVKSFPLGIDEAFDKLIKMLPGGFDRSFYGISYMEGDKMIYYAAAEERNAGEAEKYSCERLIIQKGEYLSESLTDWRSQTNCIKDIFYELLKDNRTDKTKPAVEWYKNDDEMLCMVKTITDN